METTNKKELVDSYEESMTFGAFNQAIEQVDNLREELGNAIYDAFQEEDNYPHEIAKHVINTFFMCQTEQEFEIADSMLTAVCGWNFETLINKIQQQYLEQEPCK